MPKFNMNWLYIVILAALVIAFLNGGGDILGAVPPRKPPTHSSRNT